MSGIDDALEALSPSRLTDSWNIAGDAVMLHRLSESGIPLVISLNRAQRLGLTEAISDHPLRQLLEAGVQVVLSAGMPSLYQSTLIDEYVLAHTECGLEIENVIHMARRSIERSFLDEDRKDAMLRRFDFDVKAARGLLGGD